MFCASNNICLSSKSSILKVSLCCSCCLRETTLILWANPKQVKTKVFGFGIFQAKQRTKNQFKKKILISFDVNRKMIEWPQRPIQQNELSSVAATAAAVNCLWVVWWRAANTEKCLHNRSTCDKKLNTSNDNDWLWLNDGSRLKVICKANSWFCPNSILNLKTIHFNFISIHVTHFKSL